ncbi:MAG: hypothetical protein QXP44_05970 [Candidatus Bathyarchaeia archaeon]
MQSTNSTLDYLIQQGENALSEASKATVTDTMNEVFEVHMYELLAMKYHDALRNFEEALKIDSENESALEGFCYALAETISHYERAGLSHLAEIVKVKAMPYYNEKLLDVVKKSKRIGKYLFEILHGIFPD